MISLNIFIPSLHSEGNTSLIHSYNNIRKLLKIKCFHKAYVLLLAVSLTALVQSYLL